MAKKKGKPAKRGKGGRGGRGGKGYGALLSGNKFVEQGKIDEYCSMLGDILDRWTQNLKLE
ncbi:unnamed protein product, partial [marine sediment metagenome]